MAVLFDKGDTTTSDWIYLPSSHADSDIGTTSITTSGSENRYTVEWDAGKRSKARFVNNIINYHKESIKLDFKDNYFKDCTSTGYSTIEETSSNYKIRYNNLYDDNTVTYKYDFDDSKIGSFVWRSPVSPIDRMREIIRSRKAPAIIVRPGLVAHPVDQREVRARETLRMLIGEDEYRMFLKRGFVSLRAKSGLVYQIFPGDKHTPVWKNGQIVEELCAVLTGGFTPTDSIIMRYLLITNDEADFRKRCNTWSAKTPQHTREADVDTRPLPLILSDLKKQAA